MNEMHNTVIQCHFFETHRDSKTRVSLGGPPPRQYTVARLELTPVFFEGLLDVVSNVTLEPVRPHFGRELFHLVVAVLRATRWQLQPPV